ncbi:MAG: minor capsid protein [Pseudoleptotrichia goodfellowii]|nr:minor capsid protein [Pseudoleptotrichia goodfellowii]
MSKKYWQDRFIEEEERLNKIAGDEFRRQQLEYERAIARMNKDIEAWYNRIAKNNDVSLVEAKKLLNDKELKEFKWTLDEYIKHGEENGIKKDWSRQLENASARVHIERLEAMKLQIRGEIEKLYNGRESGFESYLKNLYKDQYNRTAFQIAKGTGVGTNIYSLNDKLVNTVIKKPWAPDGKNFSDRIWEDKDKLINTLHTEMTQAFIRGDSLEKLADKIAEKMKVSKANASRLIYTESAAYSSKARIKSYQDLGVEKYEIVATLDSRTSEICQELDGKVFDMKDYEIGTTAPPFHVHCRTTTAPWFEDINDDGERAARSEETGKTEYVSANMSYKDWKKRYVREEENPMGAMSGKILTSTDKSGIINLNKIKPITKEELIYKDPYKIILEKENYRNWKILIDEKNKDVIEKYTGDHFSQYNGYLRGLIKEVDDNTIEEIENLKNILSKYTTDQTFTVYRGTYARFGIENNKVGDVVILDKGFTSSTFAVSVTDEFSGTNESVIYRIRIPKGKNVGAYVDEFSHFKGEEEFIFLPETKFRILKISSKEILGGKQYIYDLEVE